MGHSIVATSRLLEVAEHPPAQAATVETLKSSAFEKLIANAERLSNQLHQADEMRRRSMGNRPALRLLSGHMKRVTIILALVCTVVVVGYFTASKWLIRHETLTFYDPARNGRPVAVDVAVRRDKEMQARAGMIKLPVAIINHGNTVKFTEYSFLANVFAARSYLAISIQHDLDTDEPLVTKVGEPYVGRLPVYERGIANMVFAIDKLKPIMASADYDHLTMVGHSNGGDISMYFAKLHPDRVKKVVTLDNLRVPFRTDGKFKILSFRSKDPAFKTDPGVVPDPDLCARAGITVVETEYPHIDMSDRGPDKVKITIKGKLNKFLDEDDTLTPIETNAPELTESVPVAGAWLRD